MDNSTREPAAEAQRRSQEARAHLDSATCEALLNVELAAVRENLLARIVAGCVPEKFEAASRRWLAATTSAAPAHWTPVPKHEKLN